MKLPKNIETQLILIHLSKREKTYVLDWLSNFKMKHKSAQMCNYNQTPIFVCLV